MPNLSKLGPIFLTAVLVMALTPVAGLSQNVYGTIAGTVTDATAAVVGSANMTLTNLDTGEARNIQTDASGNYTFVNILPGRYRLETEKIGFKKFLREPIVVQIESGLRIDVALEVGEITQTVEVSSEVPLLQPETNSLGQVVETRTVTDLPLNGRNPLALVGLVAGVVPQGAPSAGNSSMGSPVGANPFAAGDFQIGGGMAGQSQILIDGVP
ncbi:MAG TPA: carboxypeptidase-like regulatory domain-containing protein, partial [Candidatus Dormibacteraeota bacterium]|nr:carboxypeptidase-like regulatory domain-containing protein [Candidatus Dormibacteraeota bacterium]